MNNYIIPSLVGNFIDGKECSAKGKQVFPKHCPATGKVLFQVSRSDYNDINTAVCIAKRAQPLWEEQTVVSRADILRAAAIRMTDRKEEIARIVAIETGKSFKDALGETNGAIEMGFFLAGEGRRFYGRTTTSAVPNKNVSIIRQPLGIAGLIVAANTPIANVAWKAFPALLCGNAAILKASEDTPLTALVFAEILHEAGMPAGVFNVIQGFGEEAGQPLVDCPEVDIISFTGSYEVGKIIQQRAGSRLAKVCMELGGKNPLIVCDDADLEAAVQATVLSAFSNAGQRCAAGSRIIVFSNVYDKFRTMLLDKVSSLKVGNKDTDDFGPVINEKQLNNMLKHVEEACSAGATILAGGRRLCGPDYDGGYYMAPTVIENAGAEASISHKELFGPITCLYKVCDFSEAIQLANNSRYGLTASIHTRNIHRAMVFVKMLKAGAVIINGPTYGSEPHMPFGGLKDSGNGFREAGSEALDVYSDWKTISINYNPALV